MTELALAWVLRRPELASAIVGASRPEQVHANARASGIELSPETLRVHMSGACVGCALSPVTLHGWIEGAVRPFFPNLNKVESV